MAWPGIFEKLFANGGAGPKLRGDIIPVDEASILLDEDGNLSSVSSPGVLVGKIDLLPFRPGDLVTASPYWYFCNGDQYALTSPVGQALNSLSANFKADWGITVSGSNISVPNMFYSDGRGYFLRAVDGTTKLVGSVADDQMRPITGQIGSLYASPFYGGVGALYPGTDSANTAQATTSYKASGKANLDSSRLGDNFSGDETHPLERGMTPAIFLGV